MNYANQLGMIFSPGDMEELNPRSLDEQNGLPKTGSAAVVIADSVLGDGWDFERDGTKIDWNRNGVFDTELVSGAMTLGDISGCKSSAQHELDNAFEVNADSRPSLAEHSPSGGLLAAFIDASGDIGTSVFVGQLNVECPVGENGPLNCCPANNANAECGQWSTPLLDSAEAPDGDLALVSLEDVSGAAGDLVVAYRMGGAVSFRTVSSAGELDAAVLSVSVVGHAIQTGVEMLLVPGEIAESGEDELHLYYLAPDNTLGRIRVDVSPTLAALGTDEGIVGGDELAIVATYLPGAAIVTESAPDFGLALAVVAPPDDSLTLHRWDPASDRYMLDPSAFPSGQTAAGRPNLAYNSSVPPRGLELWYPSMKDPERPRRTWATQAWGEFRASNWPYNEKAGSQTGFRSETIGWYQDNLQVMVAVEDTNNDGDSIVRHWPYANAVFLGRAVDNDDFLTMGSEVCDPLRRAAQDEHIRCVGEQVPGGMTLPSSSPPEDVICEFPPAAP